MQTTVSVKSLDLAAPALARTLSTLGHKGRDVVITARESVTPSTFGAAARTSCNALIEDLDDAYSVYTSRGCFGGDNDYNKAPSDVAWHPDFDDTPREVPVGGAIVVGHVGHTLSVYVHPTTFAERYVACDAARDALLEGRTDALVTIQATEAGLTDPECAILYAHACLKSGDYRKRVTTKHATALDACVERGLVKRASNGACAITTAGKALRDVWYRRGEDVVYACER